MYVFVGPKNSFQTVNDSELQLCYFQVFQL